MRKIIILIFLVSIVFLFSCREKNAAIDSEFFPKNIIPEVSRDSIFQDGKTQKLQPETRLAPRISIGHNYSVIYIKDINLDFDVEDEQVIIASHKESKHDFKIMILDFDSVRNKYAIAWEILKTNINYRSISVSYIDIVGDHNLEIIFSAVSLEGKQILEVYRKTHSPSGISLYYESVCSIEVDGQVDLVEKERSQAYTLGQKNGVSFPIVTYVEEKNRGKESESMLKTTYVWNYQENRYINAFEESIPLEILEEQKINRMLFEGIDAYKQFLDGQWYNVNSDNFIIRFNKDENEVSFFTTDILEIYKWTDFNYSRLNKTIDISVQNDLIHFIQKRIYIKIESMNRIRVEIRDRENLKDIDQMNGYYERISDDILTSLFKPQNELPETLKLEGDYTSQNETIFFDNFSFHRAGERLRQKGIYSIYNYNNDMLLELRFLDENNLYGSTALYKINFDTKETDGSVINRLTLVKGYVTANQFKAYGEDPVVYTQSYKKEQ